MSNTIFYTSVLERKKKYLQYFQTLIYLALFCSMDFKHLGVEPSYVAWKDTVEKKKDLLEIFPLSVDGVWQSYLISEVLAFMRN